MTEKNIDLSSKILELKQRITDLEQGGDEYALDLAEALLSTAALYKLVGENLLDAANYEARAKALIAKLSEKPVTNNAKERNETIAPIEITSTPPTYTYPRRTHWSQTDIASLPPALMLTLTACLMAAALFYILTFINESKQIQELEAQQAQNRADAAAKKEATRAKEAAMLNLAGIKFKDKFNEDAYVYFRDDKNVDIQTRYSRYDYRSLGVLTGQYSVTGYGPSGQVRIEYLLNGANRVANYDLDRGTDGARELSGYKYNVEPLPNFLTDSSK